MGASLECANLLVLWNKAQEDIPKRYQGTALQEAPGTKDNGERQTIGSARESEIAGSLGRCALTRKRDRTDLSRSGCFVLTGGKVEVKELVWLEIQLTDQQIVNFWAEVVDAASEIGFALKFNSSSPEDEAALAKYLEGLFQSQGQIKT